jgi:hypothetical protein
VQLLLVVQRRFPFSLYILKKIFVDFQGPYSVAAAAGATIYHRKAISSFASLGWEGVSDHLTYVGELWKVDDLRSRLDKIIELDDENDKLNRVGFHWFVRIL